ncbi:MAG: hypothetical protein OQJ80_02505 [Kangiella sp.]|nr:hypothetical protein [Kangiella sp.]
MNWKRYIRIVMAFLTALVVIGPAAYLLIVYGVASAMMGYESKWISTAIISLAIILVIVITGIFTSREIRQSRTGSTTQIRKPK